MQEPERRLAAILAADVVGYSRMMGEDDAGTASRIAHVRRLVFDDSVSACSGRIFKVNGDGLLAEFPSAVLALSAALRIQAGIAEVNAAWPAEQHIVFRMGVHQGEVMVVPDTGPAFDLIGDGVNVAARLEPLAFPGGICVSDRVREDAAGKLRLDFEDLGEPALKNIARPIRVWRVHPLGSGPAGIIARPAAAAETETETAPRHNLPVEATSFIGRETEIAEISVCLQERRRLTLVGAGGVGKTRTALRIGTALLAAYPDGVWLVELAPLSQPDLVAEALCRVIAAPVAGTRPAPEIATAFLRQKQSLVILDNCEHVLAAAAQLAAGLLAQCPGIAVLATSREPLKIPGEVVHKLASLPVPGRAEGETAADALRFAAVRLFVERAADAGGQLRLSDADAAAVSRICRRLDGMAMAIELAAARARVLKPAEIATRLDSAFRLLNTGGNKAALPHQQTLWATIDWSHSLLAPEEQALLRRLCVFIDGFSLEGAAAVSGMDPLDVLDLLELLADKSLINVDMSGSATRFRMLEATRHYAHEKLRASGELGGHAAAAAWMESLFRQAEQSWATTATETWLETYAPEVENLRAAIAWAFGLGARQDGIPGEAGDPALGVALVASAGSLAEELSLQADMRRWTQAALAHLTATTPPSQAGWVRFWATKWEAVFGAARVSADREAAIALFREARDPIGLSCALRTAAMAVARPGDMPAVVAPMLAEAIALLRPLAPTKDLATALGHMGSMHYFNGDHLAARQFYEEAQAMRRTLGDRSGGLASALNLAELDFVCGRRDLAIAGARAALLDARRFGSLATLANLQANLAGYLLAAGQAEEAACCAREALVLNRALDHHDWAVLCLEHLALAAALSGDTATAGRLAGFTTEHFRRTDQVRDLLEQSGYDRLRALLDEALVPSALAALLAEGERWPVSVADRVALAVDAAVSHEAAAA